MVQCPSSPQPRAALLALAVACGLVAACVGSSSPSPPPVGCERDEDCPLDQRCVEQACLPREAQDLGTALDLAADVGPVDLGGGDQGLPDQGSADLSPVDQGPSPDQGDPADAAPPDQGPSDQGPSDQGPSDQGPADQGPSDQGPGDQGEPSPDGSALDGGGGEQDAGAVDLGSVDAGPADLGPGPGPLACDDDRACPAGQRCRLFPDPADLQRVATFCGPALGPAAGGAACVGDDECATGTCLPGGVCFAACAVDAACPRGTACSQTELVLDDRGTADPGDDLRQALGACLPLPNEPCTRDADCGADSVCRAGAAAAEGGLALFCQAPVGPVAGGEACRADADCATGICFEGACYAACAAAADCPAEWLCGRLLISLPGGARAELPACLPRPAACLADAECAADEACFPYVDDEGLTALCAPAAGARSGGEACVVDADCRSGYCMGPEGGERRCMGLCRADGDCAVGARCYPDQIYVDLAAAGEAPRFDSLPACAPDHGSHAPCQRDAECPGEEICLPVPDRHREHYQLVCRDPENPLGGGPGAGCVADGFCASGTCIPIFFDFGICLGVCALEEDCEGGGACSEVLLTDGGFDPGPEDDLVEGVSLCVP